MREFLNTFVLALNPDKEEEDMKVLKEIKITNLS